MRPEQVSVTLSLPLIGQISGTWRPQDAERKAAWELYVELVTRVSVVRLPQDEGLLREALTSLHSLFDITRGILRKYGPDVAPARGAGELSFGVLAVSVLNGAVRPLLTYWHPVLLAHEQTRRPGADPVEHERSWDREPELRAALDRTQAVLTDLAAVLAETAGVADLRALPRDTPSGRENPENERGGVRLIRPLVAGRRGVTHHASRTHCAFRTAGSHRLSHSPRRGTIPA